MVFPQAVQCFRDTVLAYVTHYLLTFSVFAVPVPAVSSGVCIWRSVEVCLCTQHLAQWRKPALCSCITDKMFSIYQAQIGKNTRSKKNCRCTEVDGRYHSAQPKTCCNAPVTVIPINYVANQTQNRSFGIILLHVFLTWLMLAVLVTIFLFLFLRIYCFAF